MSLNLTPMIDIVFLLLCYFLMMSQFRTPEGVLGARLPATRGGVLAEIPRTPIRVRFQPDAGVPARCTVTIDQFTASPLEIHLLAGKLRQIREGAPGFDADTPVHLLADDDVAWDHVVNAYNAALAAEYMKIFFAGSP
jgi:biopolymer transport protein ExbD